MKGPNELVFVLDTPFWPSLMFATKARNYLSEAPYSCFSLG